jgi:hypothetical protein
MSRTLQKTLGGLTVLAVVICGQMVARASRDIHLPGTACRPRKGDVGKVQLGNQSLVNEDSASATVACPITYQDNPAGSDPSSFKARVIDRSTSGNVSCTLFAFPELEIPTGGQLFQTTRTTSGNGSTIRELAFTVPDESLHFQVYTMTCTLPGASSSSTRSEIFDYTLYQQF